MKRFGPFTLPFVLVLLAFSSQAMDRVDDEFLDDTIGREGINRYTGIEMGKQLQQYLNSPPSSTGESYRYVDAVNPEPTGGVEGIAPEDLPSNEMVHEASGSFGLEEITQEQSPSEQQSAQTSGVILSESSEKKDSGKSKARAQQSLDFMRTVPSAHQGSTHRVPLQHIDGMGYRRTITVH